MKVAVIGSRHAAPSAAKAILQALPAETSEIISGGASGIDRMAEQVAEALSIPVRVFLPQYDRYGRAAPLRRNGEIVACADLVLAFWDGHSVGTSHTVAECIRTGKPVRVILIESTK